MELLFEAKATVENQYALYNIYRIDTTNYRAQLITDGNGDYDEAAPMELIVSNNNGKWQTEDSLFEELAATIGAEIDVFNNGYGAILGRIGIE